MPKAFPKLTPMTVIQPRMVRCAWGGHLFDERKASSGSALFCSQDHHDAYVAKYGKGAVRIQENAQ